MGRSVARAGPLPPKCRGGWGRGLQVANVTNEQYARGLASARAVRDGVQRVLIVDDSEAMQKLVSHALGNDPRLDVVGIAPDAYVARDMIKVRAPDVLVLDVEMPRMSGLDFLSRIMRLRPIPVVMFSSVTQLGSDAAIRALVLGAVDCVAKPRDGVTDDVLSVLADRVYAAATARVLLSSPRGQTIEKANAGHPVEGARWKGDFILVGASTGGVAAVEVVLSGLPVTSPPVIVSQHMPESFLTSFAARLNNILPHDVTLSRDGMPIAPGHIYLASGGTQHTGIARRDGRLVCTAIDGPKRNGHCPSVDELFLSAKEFAGQATAVILTGLGRDGAEGMRVLKDAGAYCIGQDEETSVVYGMPRVAAEYGALDVQLPLTQIAPAVVEHVAKRSKARRRA